jgi:hypothetical protein
MKKVWKRITMRCKSAEYCRDIDMSGHVLTCPAAHQLLGKITTPERKVVPIFSKKKERLPKQTLFLITYDKY